MAKSTDTVKYSRILNRKYPLNELTTPEKIITE
jgi:hypothetical protein